MGTVGISFGSPTGGSGFDVASTVSQIVTNLRNVETPWKNQLSTLTSQDSALSQIGSDLATLASALQALTDAQGVLAEKQGSSSDPNVLSLTSSTASAVAGSHTIVVTQLAQTSSYVSDAIKNDGDTLSGSLTINGKTLNIDSADNDTTLSLLESAINSGSFGVTASIVTDASGSRLSLQSNTSGAAGQITLSGNITDTTTNSAVNMSVGQSGQDAQLTVDGVQLTSASNTITGAISGVTFQLLSTSPKDANGNQENVQVQITNDNSDVETAIGKFVNAYNTVVGDLNTQEGKDSSGNPEPLDGSPMLASLQSQLESAISFTQSSGAVSSLSQLGITFSSSDDGTLTLDGNALDSELSSNYQDVVNFFQPGSNGASSFGDNMTAVLNGLSSSDPNGAISLALKQNSNEETQLNTTISNEETRITAEQTSLTNELNQANFILTEIPQQLQNINEMYSAITGFNENPQG